MRLLLRATVLIFHFVMPGAQTAPQKTHPNRPAQPALAA
jgi:hypothetical protein